MECKDAKAVSHSLCDVSEDEQAVSAVLEQLFGHAPDMLPSTLRGRGDDLRSKSGAPSAGSQDNDDVREAPSDVSQHRRTTKHRRRRHRTLADPP
jgi:hypothetical protein